MDENFPNLKKGTDIQVQETQKFPNKIKPNNPIPRYVTVKMTKIKKKDNSKRSKRKTISYKGIP